MFFFLVRLFTSNIVCVYSINWIRTALLRNKLVSQDSESPPFESPIYYLPWSVFRNVFSKLPLIVSWWIISSDNVGYITLPSNCCRFSHPKFSCCLPHNLQIFNKKKIVLSKHELWTVIWKIYVYHFVTTSTSKDLCSYKFFC